MNLRDLFIAGVCLHEGGDQPIGSAIICTADAAYAEGGYVGGAGSPAQMRRAEGINFNQNNHVVIQNDGPNGRAGPQLMKAVYEMARKGAQDELRLQLRDGGMLSGSGG
ncbi:phage tail tape measure protein [Escherichia coli]|uniref:phage tail tape measure protein n=1 Tax=Escherichia coli TaxID=562 RepID=UPI00389012B1